MSEPIDPLEALAAWCAERGVWLNLARWHADPAWSATIADADDDRHDRGSGETALAALRAAVARRCERRGIEGPEGMEATQ